MHPFGASCINVALTIPVRAKRAEGYGEDDDSQTSSASTAPPASARARWMAETLQALHKSAAEGRLTGPRIRSRKFATWLRRFVSDLLASGRLPPAKLTPTSRLVNILAAKAEGNPQESLMDDELNAFMAVLERASAAEDLEAEFAWSLFDTGGKGTISAEEFAQLRTVLACGDGAGVAAERALEAAREEGEEGTLTRELYLEWAKECRAIKKGKSPPEWTVYVRPSRVKDQVQRSEEVLDSRLLTQPFWDTNNFGRDLEPCYPGERKLPGKELRALQDAPAQTPRQGSTPRGAQKAQGSRSAKLPALAAGPAPDPDKQLEIWEQRSKRLKPYLRVKASYMRTNGTRVTGFGVLMSGWGAPNKNVKLLHAEPPEGACCPLWAKKEERPAWQVEAERYKDVDQFVSVLFHDGVEKLVPRAWVEAID